MRRFFINLKYFIEFIFVRLLFLIVYILPINISSKFGAILFRLFGRFSKSHITAIQNCHHVFPNLANREVKKIVFKSWENLGKTFIEFSIIDKILKNKNNRIKIIGKKKITRFQLINKILRVQSGLIDQGLKKGDKVLSLLENSYEQIILFFSCVTLGIIWVPIGPYRKGLGLNYIISLSQSGKKD